jgi:hypothetical protein
MLSPQLLDTGIKMGAPMPQRISRLVILVVLCTTFLHAPGVGSDAHQALAQSDVCGMATAVAEASPVDEEDSTPSATPATQTRAVTEILTLEADEDTTVDTPFSSLIWIDSGEVTLLVCEGDNIGVSEGSDEAIELAAPGTYTLSETSTIFKSGSTSVRLVGEADQSILIIVAIYPPDGALCIGGGC